MSWKDRIQVCDLEADQVLEFRCLRCGSIYHKDGQEIMDNNYRDKWLSEIEKVNVARSAVAVVRFIWKPIMII